MPGTLLITLTLTSLLAVPLHFVWMRSLFEEKLGGSKKSSWDGSKEIAQVMVVDGGHHICSEENTFIVWMCTSGRQKHIPEFVGI